MSKASKFADMRAALEPFQLCQSVRFFVDSRGMLQISLDSKIEDILSPETALQLRDWLTEVFDEEQT